MLTITRWPFRPVFPTDTVLATVAIEPLPIDHPFRKLDNIVLTPHLGYVTEETFRNHYRQMVEGIDAWFKGEPLRRLA